MFLLLSRRLALRRKGKTCLLLAEVVDVPILSVDDACSRFPLAAAACNLRRLSASWRSNLVTCIVVQKVRLAPEFVFLAKGNQGFLHQFSRKKGTPQFCAAEDVGKRVSVLIDSDGDCREVQHMLVESTSIRLTDDTACAARGRRNRLQRPTSFCRAATDNHFQFLAGWFNSRKAAREKESGLKDPRRFDTMTLQEILNAPSDSDEEEADLEVSPLRNASRLEQLKCDSCVLYYLTTKAHRAFERSAQSKGKQSIEDWGNLLVKVREATPREAKWRNIHEGTEKFQSIQRQIEKYAGQLKDMIESTFPASGRGDGCVGVGEGDSDESDVPLGRLKAAKRVKEPPSFTSEKARADLSQGDSDDDLPLSDLHARGKAGKPGIAPSVKADRGKRTKPDTAPPVTANPKDGGKRPKIANAPSPPSPEQRNSHDADDDAPLFPKKARVGDYVAVWWKRLRQWYKGTVTVVSDGTVIDPVDGDRTVPAGYSIVDYGEGERGGKSVHLLDESMYRTDSRWAKTSKRDQLWRPAEKPKRKDVSVYGGSQTKRHAVEGASSSGRRAMFCNPCGLNGNDGELVCCSGCCSSCRCLRCLRIEKVADAGEWKCDVCRFKAIDRHPTLDTLRLLPPEKCLHCQTKISKEPPNHTECQVCRSVLCHDCGCTLESDVSKGSKSIVCWVCAGSENFKAVHRARIQIWARLGNPSVDLTGTNRQHADDFALMVFRLRMQACYELVNLAADSLLKVLKKDRNPRTSMTASQLSHFIGYGAGFDLATMRSICVANSREADKDARSLVAKCADLKLQVKPLARVPSASQIFKLGLVIGNAGMHPFMDMYDGAINVLLDLEHEVEIVLLLFGPVDRTYGPVARLLKKAHSKGRVVEMGEVTASNQADVFKKARDEELHGIVDGLGSAEGSERVRAIITSKIALIQAHHLNTAFPQHPVSGTGNGFIIADSVMFPPHGPQTGLLNTEGTESMFQTSCWMLPLRPDGFDMSGTRERFGLDPDKLYLVFPALNSKLDPSAVELWLGVLESTSKDVLLWFISYPVFGAINILAFLRKSALWKDEYEKRVVEGQHLPQAEHRARLAAFTNGGRGAIFLNLCLTFPAHTTGQEGVCVGMLIICMVTSKAGSIQRAASTFMHLLGLDDCVANDQDGALALVQYWSHKDQDQRRRELRDELRKEFVDQTGPFFNQRRGPAEILEGFRKIAKNSLEEFPDGDQVSKKAVDARLPEFAPSDSRASSCPGCKPVIPCEPSSQLTLIMKAVKEMDKFVSEQLPMVESILYLALQNNLYPEAVIGSGGFTVAIACIDKCSVRGVLSIEHHRVFKAKDGSNLYNSELARGAHAEGQVNNILGRSSSVVRAVDNPYRNGDFSCAFGTTKPRGEKGEMVVFRYRELLQNQWRIFFKQEIDAGFRKTGELGDQVRVVQGAVHRALGLLNDEANISHGDVSPANLFIEGNVENGEVGIVLPDLGSAASHAKPGQISCHPTPLLGCHTTGVNPGKHDAQRPKKSKKAASSKQSDAPFVFWNWYRAGEIFQRHAEKGGTLKRLCRRGTPPFWDKAVKGKVLTPEIGQHIDLFASVRVLLWKLAPVRQGETDEQWDREATAASVSTDAMAAFIANRMPEHLKADHPRQPLMWKRLLDYLVKGSQPWSDGRGNEPKTTLTTMTSCLFLTIPFLPAEDDQRLAKGGHIEAPGGELYGTDIPLSLHEKLIKKVRIQLIPSKGVGAVAGEQLRFGDLIGIYLASCVPRLENDKSRYAVTVLGDAYTYVSRFIPKRNVRWFIDKKKSTGPIFNAPGPGQRANCKLQREHAWDDDEDEDLGLPLKIIPITVSSQTVEEGDELMITYKPYAGRGCNFVPY